MNKIFIIGLPRTGTTSISVALLEYFKVAHTAYTKRAFELADVISDCPCFSDYQQLDALFPESKFVYLQRDLDRWLPSIQMLLNKMHPCLSGENYISPILRRSFGQTFNLNHCDNSSNNSFNHSFDSPLNNLLDESHLTTCYQRHEQAVMDYFCGRDDFLSIDISQADSLPQLLRFLGLPFSGDEKFPRLNIGKRVDNWKAFKHPNKVNPNSAGREHRQFFDY